MQSLHQSVRPSHQAQCPQPRRTHRRADSVQRTVLQPCASLADSHQRAERQCGSASDSAVGLPLSSAQPHVTHSSAALSPQSLVSHHAHHSFCKAPHQAVQPKQSSIVAEESVLSAVTRSIAAASLSIVLLASAQQGPAHASIPIAPIQSSQQGLPQALSPEAQLGVAPGEHITHHDELIAACAH